ncbi:MAG: acyltransferase [Massilia sp.]|nr:MAG: acyltransferase [Massilia sp.]
MRRRAWYAWRWPAAGVTATRLEQYQNSWRRHQHFTQALYHHFQSCNFWACVAARNLQENDGEEMKLDNDIRKRINILRFMMIFGVVALHVPKYVPLGEVGPGFFDFVKAFFQHGIFRFTVAVLTFISGYLLFGSGADCSPAKLWKKKFKVLVIPFIVFNLSLLALAYLAQLKTSMTMSYQLVGADMGTWLDAGLGLSAAPMNYPLNFLRDMIVLMLLAPLFGFLLRTSAWTGLAGITLVFMSNLDGLLIFRDVMAIQFYLGGLMAVKQINMKALDKYAPLLLVIFIAICAGMISLRIGNRTLLALAAPLFVWPSASLFVHTRLGTWIAENSRYSFFIFVAHAPLLIVSWMIYEKLSRFVPYELYWVSAPFLVTAILLAVYRIAMRVLPGPFSFVIGAPRWKDPASADQSDETAAPGLKEA